MRLRHNECYYSRGCPGGGYGALNLFSNLFSFTSLSVMKLIKIMNETTVSVGRVHTSGFCSNSENCPLAHVQEVSPTKEGEGSPDYHRVNLSDQGDL